MEGEEQFSAQFWQLVNLLLRIAMQNHYRFLKQKGLTVPQMMLLYHLQQTGACTVSSIAAEFGISSAAASQLIDRTVQQGYLARREHPRGRRTREHCLTEAGQQIIKASLSAHDNWIAEMMTIVDENTQQRLLTPLTESVDLIHSWFIAEIHCVSEEVRR